MSKKMKLDGHNAHVLHDELGRDTGLLYTVNPEKCRVTVWIRVHTLSPEGIPDSYKALQTLSIRRHMLGQHGYLQSVIRELRKPVEVWREEAITYLTGMNYMSPAERIDKAFKLISNEEKKMHKKTKVNGHVVHKLPKCVGLYYTVEPEHSCIAVYILSYDPATGEHYYSEFEDISIHTAQLGRPGYLQKQIEWIARRHELNQTALKEDLYEHMHQATQKALNDTIFEEESNMNHYVLRCKIKSDNDRVILVDEYIQVIQDRNKFTLLFDKADISREEFEHFINYLHTLYGRHLYSLYDYKSAEFGNYSVTFSITTLHDSKMARESFLDILTKGIKQHRALPYRIIDLPSDPSSVEFYIQELGANAKPIYKKEWPSLLNGTLHFWPYVIQRSESRPYIHNLVDCDPSQTLSVIDGRVRGLPFHKYPLIYSDIFHKEYSDKDELVSDFRGLIDDRKIFANASKVYIEFQPDRE